MDWRKRFLDWKTILTYCFIKKLNWLASFTQAPDIEVRTAFIVLFFFGDSLTSYNQELDQKWTIIVTLSTLVPAYVDYPIVGSYRLQSMDSRSCFCLAVLLERVFDRSEHVSFSQVGKYISDAKLLSEIYQKHDDHEFHYLNLNKSISLNKIDVFITLEAGFYCRFWNSSGTFSQIKRQLIY